METQTQTAHINETTYKTVQSLEHIFERPRQYEVCVFHQLTLEVEVSFCNEIEPQIVVKTNRGAESMKWNKEKQQPARWRLTQIGVVCSKPQEGCWKRGP